MNVPMQLKDFPSDLQEEIAKKISPYHVTIMRDRGEDELPLPASGTLVTCFGKYGILTAYHVIYDTKRQNKPLFKFGTMEKKMYLVLDEVERNLPVPSGTLMPHAVGIPESEERGPDLLFLEFLDLVSFVPSLRASATKRFFSIDTESEKKCRFCLDKNLDFGVLSNSLLEGSKIDRKQPKLIEGMVRSDITFTGSASYESYEQFDYLNLIVDYAHSLNAAQTYGGSSGAGLWRIPVDFVEEDKKFRTGDPILSGMAFYQSDIENDNRRIKCHGPKSIYENVIQRLK